MLGNFLNKIKENAIRITLACVIGVVVVSCASMAAPSGGDYDLDPPVMIKSTPSINALNVEKGRIEIIFDELVMVDKPLEKVIITPPQRNFPQIRAQNNRVIVELKDTLIPNTTYTIDFTDAITDNNEQNPLENFALTFSTGDVIDSLAISGKILAADNLEPVAGMYVGIHSNLSDTAFTTLPFLRISRTNELGNFSIKGVAPGKYKIYALDDLNRDYMYDNPEEAIAFYDSIIVPSLESTVRFDSIFKPKTLEFDSLKQVKFNKLLPDDIVLRSFKSPFQRQYLQKHERLTDDVLDIYFGAPTQMPEIEVIDIPVDMTEWSVLERSAGNDTLRYWLTKPTMIEMDTIKLKVSYFATDTLNMLQPKTDTLRFVNRHKKKELVKEEPKKKKNKKGEEEEVEIEEKVFLTINTDISSSMDVYKDINIKFEVPVESFEKEKVKLQYKQDTIFEDIDFEFFKDSLNPRFFNIKHKWKPDGDYSFKIDSGAVQAYNGLSNDKLEMNFKVIGLDKYGNLYLDLLNLPPNMPAFVELLDKSDNPVRQSKVQDNVAEFLYLNPGTYYARIIFDANDNGKWDPGDYAKGIEPEMVMYYDKSFEIKAYWDLEEDWDLLKLPLDKQKPLEITKNKPKEDEKRKQQMERRDARNARNSQNNRDTRNTNSPRNNAGQMMNNPF